MMKRPFFLADWSLLGAGDDGGAAADGGLDEVIEMKMGLVVYPVGVDMEG
jgi:hypothetical protein